MMKERNPNDPVDNEILSKGKNAAKDFDESQEIYVEPKHITNKLISIRLPVDMIKDLRIIAQMRGDIGYQQIIKTYIAEGLLRDDRKTLNAQTRTSNGSNIVSVSSALSGEFPHQWGESGNDQSRHFERSPIWK